MTVSVTPFVLGSGRFSVNAYLITTDTGFVLVDTGMRSHRTELEQRLADAGCTPKTLRLIFITHGDLDHISNAAHLSTTFDAPIAMHSGDVPMARDGDMFAGRNSAGKLTRVLLGMFLRLPDEDRFEPDVLLDESSDLAEYGLAGARVVLLQGHSSGSVALLLVDGSLLCGDVLENRAGPKLGSIMDDVPTAEAAVQRLRTLDVGTVYPGHGRPFEFAELGAG